MNASLTNIFFVVSIFQLWLIGIFLFTSDKGKRSSNKLLGSFFLCVGFNLTDSFLQFNKGYDSVPFLAFWGSCLPLLFGPLIYLYTQSIFYKGFEFGWKKWRHLFLFFFFFLLTEGLYLFQSSEFQRTLLEKLEARNVPTYLPWTAGLIFLQFLSYGWASLRLIQKYKKEAREKYSDPFVNNVSWLSSAIIFFMLLMIISTFNQFTAFTAYAKYFFLIFSMLLLCIAVFISRVLFRALRQPDQFSLVDEKPLLNQPAKLGFSEQEEGKLVEQLQRHMEMTRPFLEPELTLDQLAGQLSMKPKILSQIINFSLHQNFFDFVNRYRIEEAKQLLRNSDDKKVTVLEILYKVGFNSKSSFNTLFKRYTGVTPSEFRRNP